MSSPALAAVLSSDPTSDLEWIVELDSARRSDGTPRTWYISNCGGRDRGSGNTPLPFLSSDDAQLGSFSQSLSEDVLWGGLAESSPGSIRIIDPNPELDTVSTLPEMLDYTFAGYPMRVRVGLFTSSTYDSTTFPTFHTAIIDQEPSLSYLRSGIALTFPLMSALSRAANEPLILSAYVGIPSCIKILTNSGSWSAPSDTAYDSASFMVMVRFRADSAAGAFGSGGTTVGDIVRRQTSSTNRQFRLGLHHSVVGDFSSGKLQINASIGGADTDLTDILSDLSGPPPLVTFLDDEWHALILSIQDRAFGFVMIDGRVVSDFGADTLTGSIDIPSSSAIEGGILCPGLSVCDVRFLPRFVPKEEARALYPVRASGDDLGVVGLWPMDDNAGPTINDESVTDNDATLSGTENTDWKWEATKLGEQEIAGSFFPLAFGLPFNIPLQLIDIERAIVRLNNTAPTQTEMLKTRGTALTPVTDYSDEGGGLFKLTGLEDEPLTADLTGAGDDYYLSMVAMSIGTSHTRLTSSDFDTEHIEALRVLCPWRVGWWTNADTTYGQVLSSLVAGAGLHYRETAEGKLTLDLLRPVIGPGPYGETCLDLGGYPCAPDNLITFPDIGDAPADMTIACWFKVHLFDQTAFEVGGSEPNFGTFVFVTKGGFSVSSNYTLYFQAAGPNAGKLAFRAAGDTVYAYGIVTPNVWHFGAGVVETEGGDSTLILYCGALGEQVRLVGAKNVTGSLPSTNSSSFQVGHDIGYPWGSVTYAQVWTAAKTRDQLQSLAETPPTGIETSLQVLAPIASGDGATITDLVTSSIGVVGGSPTWCPKLTIDLTETPSVELTELRLLVPAWKVTVKYRQNWQPLADADIDSGVARRDRIALKKDWQQVSLTDESIRTLYRRAREVVLESPLVEREDAQRLCRQIMLRLGVDKYIVKLTILSGLVLSRAACGLEIGDEVFFMADAEAILNAIDGEGYMVEGYVEEGYFVAQPFVAPTPLAREMRVIARSVDPLAMSTTLVLWG